jgi:hypothetical protein
VFHQTARSNGYNYLTSVAWTFTGSLLWEYAGEFREQVSINDMIFTTMGGALLGEGLRHSSLFLEEILPAGPIRFFFITLFDPMRIFNRALDRLIYDDVDADLTIINPVQTYILQPSYRSIGAGFSVRW